MTEAMPNTVKVGGLYWTIEAGDGDLKDQNAYGLTTEGKLLIQIDTGRPLAKQRVSLLHELLHAVDATFLTPKLRADERNVKTFSDGLLQVLVDNPQVRRFIFGD